MVQGSCREALMAIHRRSLAAEAPSLTGTTTNPPVREFRRALVYLRQASYSAALILWISYLPCRRAHDLNWLSRLRGTHMVGFCQIIQNHSAAFAMDEPRHC